MRGNKSSLYIEESTDRLVIQILNSVVDVDAAAGGGGGHMVV